MAVVIEIRPNTMVPGFTLSDGTNELWFAEEVHALNFAQDHYLDAEIRILEADGNLRHQYHGRCDYDDR